MYQVASNKPSPHVLITKLRKQHPDIYKELISDFKPLQHPFTLIEPLYKATGDRILFFASMIMLYGKFDNPNNMPSRYLHHNAGLQISKITGLFTSNVSTCLEQAAIYFRVPGFPEQVKQFIFDTVGITV